MRFDLVTIASVVVVACLVIMTIALGHLAWGW